MAIAFDSTGSVAQGYGTTQSWSHTITAGVKNPILFVGCWHSSSSDDIVSVKYNNILMTRIDGLIQSPDRWTYLYYMENPPIGSAYTVLCTFNTSDFLGGTSCAYTGAWVDGVHSTLGNTTSGNYTSAVTPVANNCWSLAYAKHGSQDPTAVTNCTRRVLSANSAFFDSNAAITPPALYTMTIGNGSTGGNQVCRATISPARIAYALAPSGKRYSYP